MKDDGKFDSLECSGTSNNMECGNIMPLPVTNCSYEGELIQRAEYVNGQYTYRYMQEYDVNDGVEEGVNKSYDGWAVILTDKESTEPVTSELCTYINDKPVLSMRYMFYKSKAESIDLSSFNTSNTVHMGEMFKNSQILNLDLGNFDTSNVTTMY